MRVSEAQGGQIIEIKVCGTYGPVQYRVCEKQDYPGRVKAHRAETGDPVVYLFPDNECRIIPAQETYCDAWRRYAVYSELYDRGYDLGRD